MFIEYEEDKNKKLEEDEDKIWFDDINTITL